MKISHSRGHVLGGAFLIAGTTIGVGMLALPIATGPAGFLPSILIYLACWAFMLCTGLLMLEAMSWLPPDSNLITMADRLLGKTGKTVCWLVYLFLFESVMVSHLAGGGGITSEILHGGLGLIPSILLYTLLFSPVVYLGTRAVDRINLLMFSGVLISYILFILFSASHVEVAKLTQQDWGKAWAAVPILFTAFTFQVILPTLVTYMKGDMGKVRKAIFYGTSIPLVVYIIWQVLILGIVPVEGPYGLIDAATRGENAVMPLKHFVGNPVVIGIGRAFAFFTMTASYIALSLAFLDFLADGLKVQKVGLKKGILCLGVFLPPLIISIYNPNIFLNALRYAGGISCATLFGLFPPLMVWSGRYRKGHTTGRQMLGGRLFLSILIALVALEIGLEFIPQIIG